MKLWKNLLALALGLMLAVGSVSGALALGFKGTQYNDATFETLEEARLSAPEAVKQFEGNETKNYGSMPILDGIPENTVFIYRSPNMYGGRAAGRLNTDIVVYADARFDGKAEAKAYLEGLGLIDIINEAIGSIIPPRGYQRVRRPDPHGPALQPAGRDGGRPRQFRLHRRRQRRRHAVYRSAHGAVGFADAAGH